MVLFESVEADAVLALDVVAKRKGEMLRLLAPVLMVVYQGGEG